MKQDCPNWRDFNSYEFMRQHTLAEWGWEFIRRDEGYIAEWINEFLKFKNSKRRGILKLEWLTECEFEYLCEVDDFDSYIELVKSTNRIDYRDRFKFIIPSNNAKKWGLKNYQHPKSNKFNNHNKVNLRIMDISPDKTEVESNDILEANKHENNIMAQIDLGKAIEPQLKDIKRFAIKKQSLLNQKRKRQLSPTKNLCNVWIRYLRCIDAKRLNIPRIKAANVIFEQHKTKNDWEKPDTPSNYWDNSWTKIKDYQTKYYSNFMS